MLFFKDGLIEVEAWPTGQGHQQCVHLFSIWVDISTPLQDIFLFYILFFSTFSSTISFTSAFFFMNRQTKLPVQQRNAVRPLTSKCLHVLVFAHRTWHHWLFTLLAEPRRLCQRPPLSLLSMRELIWSRGNCFVLTGEPCGRTREFTLVFTPNSGVLSAIADFSLPLLVFVTRVTRRIQRKLTTV